MAESKQRLPAFVVTSVTATTFVVTYNGTPVANNTYGFSFIVMGR